MTGRPRFSVANRITLLCLAADLAIAAIFRRKKVQVAIRGSITHLWLLLEAERTE